MFLHRRRLLESLGVFVIAAALLVPFVGSWPEWIGGDELGFVESGKTLSSAYVEGWSRRDFSDPVWKAPLNNYGCYNPRVGLFLLGALGHATAGMEEGPRVRTLRSVAALCSAVCVALLFSIVRTTYSTSSGVVASVLLMLHPAFRSMSSALLPDVPMTLFALAALLCATAFLAEDKGGKRLVRPTGWTHGLVVGFGLFAGLAISCKLYAVALLAVVPLLVWRARHHPWAHAPSFAGAAALALAVFYVSNPLLYAHPLEGILTMTSGHMGVWVGYSPAFDWFSLITAGDTLFGLFVFGHVDVDKDIYRLSQLTALPGIVHVGIVLCVVGAVIAAARRNFIALAWLAASFGLVGYVMSQFPHELLWGHPRQLILPVTALIWTIAGIDVAAVQSVAGAVRERVK